MVKEPFLSLLLPAERCLYPVTATTQPPAQGLKAEPALGSIYYQLLSVSRLRSQGTLKRAKLGSKGRDTATGGTWHYLAMAPFTAESLPAYTIPESSATLVGYMNANQIQMLEEKALRARSPKERALKASAASSSCHGHQDGKAEMWSGILQGHQEWRALSCGPAFGPCGSDDLVVTSTCLSSPRAPPTTLSSQTESQLKRRERLQRVQAELRSWLGSHRALRGVACENKAGRRGAAQGFSLFPQKVREGWRQQ